MKTQLGPKTSGTRSPSRHTYYLHQDEARRNQARYERKHPPKKKES